MTASSTTESRSPARSSPTAISRSRSRRRTARPDGVALVDTTHELLLDSLSYEGEITAAVIDGQTFDLTEGTPLEAVDSNTVTGSLSRIPDGEDRNDSGSDWEFTTTITPGAANVASG